MAKPKGRAAQFEEQEHIVKDYDPEAEGRDIGSDNDSDAGDVANTGTEHYEAVGKSKLRAKSDDALGPKYSGSKVSRAALEQDSDDHGPEEEDSSDDDDDDEGYANPDEADLEADEDEADDSEISSDDALAESDADRLDGFVFRGSSKPLDKKKGKKRATAADFMSGSEHEEDEDEEDDSGADEDMDDGLDALADGGDSEEDSEAEEDDEEESEDDSDNEKKPPSKPSGDLSAVSDVDKGLAIQQQRKAYDGLLNLRIRLQKALVAANTFPTLEDSDTDASEQPYEAAEEAAAKLLNTISDLRRVTFGPSRAGSKRKLEFTSSTPSADMWAAIQAEDARLAKLRGERLDKWAQKLAVVNDAMEAGRSSRSSKKPLSASLADHLASNEHKLVKRTKVARSCAPAQQQKRTSSSREDNEEEEDEGVDVVYDDADLYQQLLKDLVEQRTVDSTVEQASAVPSVVLSAAASAGKSRKNVDRKASKGRKMRFVVHPKIENFMAPEDRRGWEQPSIDRLFATLFGQRLDLDVEDESDDDDVDMEAHGEVRLFG